MLRNARLAVGDLIVRLTVNHPLERVLVVTENNRIRHLRHRTVRIIDLDHVGSHRMDKRRVPLGAKSRSTFAHALRQPRITLNVLRNADRARKILLHFLIQPLQE